MGGSEFAQWRALYEVEGFGYRRMDMQFALLAVILANSNRDPHKSAFKFEEFIPDYWSRLVPATGLSLAAKFRALAQAKGIEQQVDGPHVECN